MKFSAIILTSLFCLSFNAQANPVENAECSAVFRATAITLEKTHANMSAISHRVSEDLMSQSAAVIGRIPASRIYRSKMDEMTAKVRATGSTGIDRGELNYCIAVAKAYGMM
jgi:hypothetical protein